LVKASEAAVQTSVKNGVYAPDTLIMLCRVLDESFRAIIDFGPFRNDAWQAEVRIRLAQVILSRYQSGEADPAMLRRMALETVAPVYVEGTGVH
jgi:hypothetical protein